MRKEISGSGEKVRCGKEEDGEKRVSEGRRKKGKMGILTILEVHKAISCYVPAFWVNMAFGQPKILIILSFNNNYFSKRKICTF